jgi:hypothetical protein
MISSCGAVYSHTGGATGMRGSSGAASRPQRAPPRRGSGLGSLLGASTGDAAAAGEGAVQSIGT